MSHESQTSNKEKEFPRKSYTLTNPNFSLLKDSGFPLHIVVHTPPSEVTRLQSASQNICPLVPQGGCQSKDTKLPVQLTVPVKPLAKHCGEEVFSSATEQQHPWFIRLLPTGNNPDCLGLGDAKPYLKTKCFLARKQGLNNNNLTGCFPRQLYIPSNPCRS